MAHERGMAPAAEFALGLLEGQALNEAEERLRFDLDFASDVAWWEERLAGVVDGVPPLPPPRGALDAVQRSLFGVIEKTAPSRFPWRRFVLGIVTLKVALISAFFYVRAAQTETFPVETRLGEAVLSWNSRSGAVKLTGEAASRLHVWVRTASRLTYIGRGGETMTVAMVPGAALVFSQDGPGVTTPLILDEVRLTVD